MFSAVPLDESWLDRRCSPGTFRADLRFNLARGRWYATINGDPNVAKLQQYTIELYDEIEELSEQSIGLHLPGGVFLAATNERFDWLKSMHAKGALSWYGHRDHQP
ncbi:MAG: hypothetical protein CM1200mP18_17380 [Gammaproteobacteria bacterium]|nr:MAG: hypothetical protein CM1200mP18_17380 [Gammaproteobacteria bacterium]